MISIANNLMTDDMLRTIAFYTEHLEFEIAMIVPDHVNPVWVMLKNKDVILMFQNRESLSSEIPFQKNEKTGGTFNLYIRTDDVQKIYEIMKTHAQIASPLKETFYGSLEFTARDLNSYYLTVAQDLENHIE